jgi:AbrB family looped-hinge helix DNA binding protein
MVMVLLNGMKDVLVPIDQAGRIVLPKGVRQELDIQPGDVFKLSVQGAAVTLLPKKSRAGFVQKGKALIFSTNRSAPLDQETVSAILEAGRNDSAERIAAKIAGRKRGL